MSWLIAAASQVLYQTEHKEYKANSQPVTDPPEHNFPLLIREVNGTWFENSCFIRLGS